MLSSRLAIGEVLRSNDSKVPVNLAASHVIFESRHGNLKNLTRQQWRWPVAICKGLQTFARAPQPDGPVGSMS